jgi:hypothetical protein
MSYLLRICYSIALHSQSKEYYNSFCYYLSSTFLSFFKTF